MTPGKIRSKKFGQYVRRRDAKEARKKKTEENKVKENDLDTLFE